MDTVATGPISMQENQRLFQTTNWGSTPLAPTAGWPTEMRAVIDTMLASRFPVSTAWGPQLHQNYDDAYNPMNGDKHPAAFGQPAREIWPEIWGFLERSLQHVWDIGDPLTFHDALLPLAEHGAPEECWFDFS
jgi:hypothetical protein